MYQGREAAGRPRPWPALWWPGKAEHKDRKARPQELRQAAELEPSSRVFKSYNGDLPGSETDEQGPVQKTIQI